MSANMIGRHLTQYMHAVGLGKIIADDDNLLQLANKCGGYAELAAGTYTLPTLDSNQNFFYFFVGATGSVTITGVGDLTNGQNALVTQNPTGGWQMTVIDDNGSANLSSIYTTLTTSSLTVYIPPTAWREVASGAVGTTANGGGVLSSNT